VGTPLEVYERPRNLFVANFIGTPPMNLVPATVGEGGATLQAGAFTLPVPAPRRSALAGAAGRRVVVGVRPESLIEAGTPARGATAPVSVEVEIVEPLGHEVIVYGRAGQDLLTAKLAPLRVPGLGERLELQVELDSLHLFDAETEARLS
jgi:multiple sugar transport system ATP-binding protein